ETARDEPRMRTEEGEGERGQERRSGDGRFWKLEGAEGRTGHGHGPLEQGPPYHEPALPADWGNDLIRDRFVAPDEPMPPVDHSPEKVLVLAGPKLRSERRSVPREASAPHRNVVRTSL